VSQTNDWQAIRLSRGNFGKLIEEFKLSLNDILVIDDMPVGYEMAKNAGVDFIWAQWAYFDESLNQRISKTSSQSLLDVNALYEILEFDF